MSKRKKADKRKENPTIPLLENEEKRNPVLKGQARKKKRATFWRSRSSPP